jgi:hypothetical protein
MNMEAKQYVQEFDASVQANTVVVTKADDSVQPDDILPQEKQKTQAG